VKPHVVWIGIVCGLLLMSAVAYGTLLAFALMDPSFAVEEDYEQKARDWDRIARERARSQALGWQVELRTAGTVRRGTSAVELTLHDRDGAPIDGAAVELVAFHNARASHRLRARLHPEGGGRYVAELPLHRPGLWEFRLRIGRDDDIYVGTIRKMLAAGGGASRQATR